MKTAHSAEEKGELTITTKRLDDIIQISFKDNGTGISKENLRHMFQPFFTTRPVGEGTGLGLSLSRAIIIEHGGTIHVESELGKGATFIIELPVSRKPLSDNHRQKDKAVPNQTPTTKGSKQARILVVDDEPTIQNFIKATLTSSGYKVDTTEIHRKPWRK